MSYKERLEELYKLAKEQGELAQAVHIAGLIENLNREKGDKYVN